MAPMLFSSYKFPVKDIHCESKSSPSPETFCDIFTSGEPVLLKIIVATAQTHSYVLTNVGPFIWISVWIVSTLLVRAKNFNNSILFITKICEFFARKQVTLHDI